MTFDNLLTLAVWCLVVIAACELVQGLLLITRGICRHLRRRISENFSINGA